MLEAVLLTTCAYVGYVEWRWQVDSHRRFAKLDAVIADFEDAVQGVREVTGDVAQQLEKVENLREVVKLAAGELRNAHP
jgi:hypothetical protein